LKQIKRKVNSANRKSSLDEDGFYEMPERELRTRPRKNLEDIYSSIENTFEELNKRQEDLESKLDSMGKRNEVLEQENDQMDSELCEKRNYLNKLEALIFLIMDRYASEYDGSLTSLSKKILPEEMSSLNSLVSSLEPDKKVSLVQTLFNQLNTCPNIIDYGKLKKLVKQKHDENQNLEIKESLDLKETIYSSPKHMDLCETNVSSPTSLLSTHECIFATPSTNLNSYITPLLSIKRKRTDESKDELETVSFETKNKDSLFEEMTRLTPCLISSPTLSPREKNLQSKIIFIYSELNIFASSQRFSNINSEAFYIYSFQEKGENCK
jgi:hypothetical protein